MLIALDLVVCPIVFNLFYDQDGQGGVFKDIKNDNFLVFLDIWVLSHNLPGRWRSELY